MPEPTLNTPPNVRGGIAVKLKTARALTGMSTRAVAAELSSVRSISHATLANYEAGKSVPPFDVLAALADVYEKPIDWFRGRAPVLQPVHFWQRRGSIKAAALRSYVAGCQAWIDGYVALEGRLGVTAEVRPGLVDTM